MRAPVVSSEAIDAISESVELEVQMLGVEDNPTHRTLFQAEEFTAKQTELTKLLRVYAAVKGIPLSDVKTVAYVVAESVAYQMRKDWERTLLRDLRSELEDDIPHGWTIEKTMQRIEKAMRAAL